MTKRLLTLMAVCAAAACGEPFAPEPPSEGPPLGALRINVAMEGNGTFDDNGFLVTSPFFELPFPWYGGSQVTPGLPEGLTMTIGFEDLAEWCPISPPTRQAVIREGDTTDVDFTVTCRTLYRPVRFYAFAVPETLPAFEVQVQVGLLTSFALMTGESRLDSFPVNDWPVTVTLPSPCRRAPGDQTFLRLSLYPADTARYTINAICDGP